MVRFPLLGPVRVRRRLTPTRTVRPAVTGRSLRVLLLLVPAPDTRTLTPRADATDTVNPRTRRVPVFVTAIVVLDALIDNDLVIGDTDTDTCTEGVPADAEVAGASAATAVATARATVRGFMPSGGVEGRTRAAPALRVGVRTIHRDQLAPGRPHRSLTTLHTVTVPPPPDVQVEMLGGFRVQVGDRVVGEEDWPTRRAQELVALLALAHGHRLVRDEAIEHLWPHLGLERGAANLRKAAHHARRALGAEDAVVLRGGRVELFPDRAVVCDVERFLHESALALQGTDDRACARVAASYAGDLLPASPYESWTQDARRRARAQLTELLRRAGQWEQLLDVEPTDETACRELMRAAIEAGQRHVALRWYERLRIAMARDLGAQPGAETRALYDRCTAGIRLGERAFVGRRVEVARIAAALTQAAAGETAAVLVRGTAGIGKSALCREVMHRARDDGWRILTVRATAAGAPYDPVGSAIGQVLVDGRAALDALPQRTQSVLAELSSVAGPAPRLDGALTRHQVVAALRRVLALGDADCRTLLCVEDAHLCDEASADVLHQLVAAGGDRPLVVLLACRGEWMRMSLPRGIRELADGDRTMTLDLAPLDDEAIAQLVTLAARDRPSPDAVEAIVDTARGHPLFALELARTLGAEPSSALPDTVRAAIGRRFAGLDVDALATLAIVEDDLDIPRVIALTGLDEPGAFALLDAALDAGVLVVAGTRYRFRHELVRQALIDGVPGHRRLELHRDAARRLEAAGAADELVARHWLAGERPDAAVPWLLRAARHAVKVGAFADALGQVERLLNEEPANAEALCLRAEILDALGDNQAPDAYAAAAVAVGEPEAQELKARQALAQLKASDPASALRTLEGITPRTTVGRLAEALTLSAAAAIGVYADADTAAAKADEAHRLAIELGDPGAILDATWAHALAAHAKGELPARLREYLRATRHLPEIATRVFDGQLCVTERMLYGGLPNAEIIAFADGLADEARRLGAARGHAFALTLRGEAEILAGRLDEADRDFAEGARLHGRIGALAGEALSLLGRAQAATYRGRPEHARPFLADALMIARESEVGHHTLDRIYGAMVEAADDPSSGLQLVREAESAIRGPAETCPTCRIAFIVPAAIAAARAGDLERADRYAEACETALEIIALPPAWHAAVEEVRGWVARAHGRPDDARDHLQRAADGFRAWGQPLDAQRCAALARL
jgi:DNA-binding SARP family transcriptional activator/tetratricopeptide (TPR) repeat protein